MMPNHFVIFWNNKPIGVDRDSGGYPYKIEQNSNPSSIRYWKTREEAQNYIDIFQRVDSENRYRDMLIKEIQFRIV